MVITIPCVYSCKSVSFENFVKVVSAVNEQVRRDFSPHWQKYATLFPYQGDPKALPKESWKITVLDDPLASEMGALGYHDATPKSNVPEGKVFAKYCETNGSPWSSVLSHEVLELLGDEWVNLLVARGNQLWWRELCDAVQDDNYQDKHGVMLSNFVLPDYFVEGSDGPYDFRHLIKKPFEIRPGGYAGYIEIAGGKMTEKQIFGERYAEWRKGMAVRKSHRMSVLEGWK